MNNDMFMREYNAVYKLGMQIGFGNLMQLATLAWQNELKDTGYPTEIAFYPTILDFMTDVGKKSAIRNSDLYREIYENREKQSDENK